MRVMADIGFVNDLDGSAQRFVSLLQDGRVLRERRAVIEPERGHAAQRVDLQILRGFLLALGQVHALQQPVDKSLLLVQQSPQQVLAIHLLV